MGCVAAFRVHEWDADIAALADRFVADCPSARQVVLADVMHGPLPITPHEVTHAAAMEPAGLLQYPPDPSSDPARRMW